MPESEIGSHRDGQENMGRAGVLVFEQGEKLAGGVFGVIVTGGIP